MTVVIGSNQFV